LANLKDKSVCQTLLLFSGFVFGGLCTANFEINHRIKMLDTLLKYFTPLGLVLEGLCTAIRIMPTKKPHDLPRIRGDPVDMASTRRLPSPRYSLFSKEGSFNSKISRVIGWKRIVPSVFPFKQRLSQLKSFIKLADFFPHDQTSRNVELIPIMSAGAKVVQASNWAFPLSCLSLMQERTRSGFTLKML